MISWIALAVAVSGVGQTPVPAPADPLTVEIETQDADRFAALFLHSNGHPTAEQLQREYLDPGSYGVRVFTPGRIRDAETLAARIAKQPEVYDRAIRTCLPIVKETTGELRATYLALRGIFPELPLPRMYLVVGADNSGGTAGPGAQVLGLETLCKLADSPEKLRKLLRAFYGHETVHTFQADPEKAGQGGTLLGSVLTEGAADFIATLASGQQSDPERAAWASPREAELWRQFEADLALTSGASWDDLKKNPEVSQAFHRWIGNYGKAPEGWPSEVGYWMGQRIWQRWYDRQPDKHAALRAMLEMKDPQAVLQAGRFPL